MTGVEVKTDTPFPYTELFEKCLPYYMAMGMTYDEYWHGDSSMPIAYKKAFKLKRRFTNENMWMQGAYVYKVLEAFAPILPAFPKPGAKVGAYTDILPFTAEDEKELSRAKAEKESLAMASKFAVWAANFTPKNGGDEQCKEQ